MPSAESTHIFNLGPDWQETGGQEDRSRGPNHPHLIPSSYYANMNVTLSLLCPIWTIVWFGKVTNPKRIKTRIIIVFTVHYHRWTVQSVTWHWRQVHMSRAVIFSLSLCNYIITTIACHAASGLLHIITSSLLHIITVGSSMGTLCTCVLTICNNIIE